MHEIEPFMRHRLCPINVPYTNTSGGRNFDRQTTIRKVHKTVLFVLQENCIGVTNGVTNGVTEVEKKV